MTLGLHLPAVEDDESVILIAPPSPATISPAGLPSGLSSLGGKSGEFIRSTESNVMVPPSFASISPPD